MNKEQPASQKTATVDISSLAYGGDGVGKIGEKVVFVPDTVPGDRVVVRVLEDRKSFSRAVVEEVADASPARTEPFCVYADRCGGCQWQHIDYDTQLQWKRTIVEESLRRISGMESAPVEPCLPSPADRAYRTTARYPARTVGGRLHIGYFARRSHRIVDIESCPAAADGINAIVGALRKELSESPAGALVDEITVRSSHNVASSLLTISTKEPCDLGGVADRLLADIPGIKGVVHRSPANPHPRIRGEGYRLERINGKTLKIRDRSFFQTNVPQTERLVGLAGGILDCGPSDVLVDGYGGVGLFSLCTAPAEATVHLYDLSGSAVKDSRENAAALGFSSFSAHLMDTVQAAETVGRADLLVLDPPRPGMGKAAVDAAASLGARRIAYVSCNPATMARDMGFFAEAGYAVERVVPADMFPHTYHIETVTALKRKR